MIKPTDQPDSKTSPIRKWLRLSVFGLFLWCCFSVGAEDSAAAGPAAEDVATLSLYPEEQLILSGETAVFRVIAVYANGTEMVVDYVEFTGDKPGTFPVVAEYCGKSAAGTVVVLERKKISEVVLSPAEAIIRPGENAQFRLDAIYEDGATAYIKAIHYSGYVPGRFTVTGEYQGNSDSATVLVLPAAKIARIYLDPIEQSARSGDRVTFELLAGYENDSAVHIKNVYFIAGDNAGRQNVSYTYLGRVAKAAIIVVTDKKVLKVILDPASLTLTAGETATFKLKALLEDGTEVFVRNIDYSDTAPGVDTITGKYAGKKAVAAVTVLPLVVLNRIWLKPSQQTAKPGETVRFDLHAGYSDGTTTLVKPVEFSAGDLRGRHTVTCTHQGQTASATIIVEEEIRLVEVVLLPDRRTIETGETAELELIGRYSNGTRQKLKSVSFSGDKAGTFTVTEQHQGTTASVTVIVEKTGPPEQEDPGFSSAGGTTLLVEASN